MMKYDLPSLHDSDLARYAATFLFQHMGRDAALKFAKKRGIVRLYVNELMNLAGVPLDWYTDWRIENAMPFLYAWERQSLFGNYHRLAMAPMLKLSGVEQYLENLNEALTISIKSTHNPLRNDHRMSTRAAPGC